LVFLVLYWGYCLTWGIVGFRRAKTASDYFIAGRQLPLWVFVLAATAASFSGWTFMGHPGLVYRDGFQYAYASFYTITIPFTGVMFLKRQWILGKRFGYITPGEMLSDYHQGDAIRLLTVLVAVLYSIPYMGVQLGAAGYLFSVVSDNVVSKEVGMSIFGLVLLIYVASGGLRAVAYVQTLQCVLLAGGIVITGFIALNTLGGWDPFINGMAELAKTDVGKWGTTMGHGGGDYNAYFAIPGVIQWTAGLGKETPVGGLWTGVMVLTYMFALMGIQSSPAFSMWSFSNTNPKPFAPQQVWASSFGVGLILFVFTTFQGLGAHLLGANPLVNAIGLPETLPAVSQYMASHAGAFPLPPEIAKSPDSIVPHYFNLLATSAPWLIGFLSICAFAAMESTGTAYVSTVSGIITRDLYKRYINPAAAHSTQKLVGRLSVFVVVVIALAVATYSSDALVLLGGLAVAFGFQMWPALASVCWFPWLTRQGVSWGLAAGLLGVIFTDSMGMTLSGGALPWGRWPLTIHSAGWGILVNVIVCVVVSAMTQNEQASAHRMKYHTFLKEHASLPASKKGLVPIAWIITLAWFFFGIGPGAVIGNDIFGAPNAGVEGWTFGIPSIWAWQILFWALGVFMMWFLAYKVEMSTVPSSEVEALVEDIGDTSLAKPGA
jgi:Na+/proline symporter